VLAKHQRLSIFAKLASGGCQLFSVYNSVGHQPDANFIVGRQQLDANCIWLAVMQYRIPKFIKSKREQA
jgi:hypothetical protein